MVYIAISFRRRQLRDKPLDLLYSVVVVFLFFTQPIALRLVCHGNAARWESASIQQLTHSASFHTSGLNFLADGKHDAVFVARGACRNVYRIGESVVLKLSRRKDESNWEEAASFRLHNICLKHLFLCSPAIAILLLTALRFW